MSRRSAWQALTATIGLDRFNKNATSQGLDVEGAEAFSGAPTDELISQELSGPSSFAEIPPDAGAPLNITSDEGVVDLKGNLDGNTVHVGKNIILTGQLHGKGNVVRIAGTRNPQKVHLNLFGHNNRVTIGARSLMQHLRIEIGSTRWPCSRAKLRIGSGFSIGSQGRLILSNSGNVVEIGDNCMFSSGITVRGGEYPHLVFDKETGEYLDVSDGIFIGNHVWIGEGVFISKAVTIPNECIVGAKSVLTKRFDEENCVLAGNPARVVKKGVQWVAHEILLKQEFPRGYNSFHKANVSNINRKERKNAESTTRVTPLAGKTEAE